MKNLPVKLAVLAIMITLITGTLVSGTFAKYVQGISGTDSVRVAKFAFNLTDGTSTADQDDETMTMDIFSTTDDGIYNNGSGGTFIAPGTSGSFVLEVENLSEVNVALTFDMVETNTSNIPIYYTIGEDTQRYSSVLTGGYGEGDEEYNDLSELASVVGATLQADDGEAPGTTAAYNLNWTWAFSSAGTGQSDAGDTALGKDGTAQVSLSITATVTQVD